MRKTINLISSVILLVTSVSASASMMYDKQELIQSINQAASLIKKIPTNKAPLICVSHIKSAYNHADNAKSYAYADDSVHTFDQLVKAEKALSNLKFEGYKCERQTYQSKNALDLIHVAEHLLEFDGLKK